MVLATNGTITLAAFLYNDIQWGRRAQIGFNAGDGYSSFMLDEALTDQTADIDKLSNVEKPGVFIFRLDSKDKNECKHVRCMQDMSAWLSKTYSIIFRPVCRGGLGGFNRTPL